jgi:hypothetical protein
VHLDLDTLAWQPEMPPRRRPVEASVRDVVAFMDAHDAWVIEGCYADLLDAVAPRSTRLVFLDPGVEACIANARRRPWEPHKYESAAAQDANLEMLVAWIRDYEARSDEFSRAAHRALFERFAGDKIALTSCDGIGAFSG